MRRPFPSFGLRLFLAAVSLRIAERWWHTWDMRRWMPEIAIDAFPIWGMPIELWPTPWPEVLALVGLALCAGAYGPSRARTLCLALLLPYLWYTATGGAAVGKALIFMVPMALYCTLLSASGELLRLRLSAWAASMGWGFLAGMYGFNALSKTGPEWLEGSAFAHFVTSNFWGPGWYTQPPEGAAWRLLSYGIMLWELLGFLLIFAWPRFRTCYGVAALLFHGALMWLSPFKTLGLCIFSLWLMLWGNRQTSLKELARERRWAFAVCVAWLAWLGLANLEQLKLPPLPKSIRYSMAGVSLYPSWRLFAPSPARGHISARLEAPGRVEEVKEGGGRMSFLLDAARFDLMWNHLGQRLCQGRSGQISLTIESSHPQRRSQDCAYFLEK